MPEMTVSHGTDSVQISKVYVLIDLCQHFFHGFQLLRGKAAEGMLQKDLHKGLSFLGQGFAFVGGDQTFEPPVLICLEPLEVSRLLQVVFVSEVKYKGHKKLSISQNFSSDHAVLLSLIFCLLSPLSCISTLLPPCCGRAMAAKSMYSAPRFPILSGQRKSAPKARWPKREGLCLQDEAGDHEAPRRTEAFSKKLHTPKADDFSS